MSVRTDLGNSRLVFKPSGKIVTNGYASEGREIVSDSRLCRRFRLYIPIPGALKHPAITQKMSSDILLYK